MVDENLPCLLDELDGGIYPIGPFDAGECFVDGHGAKVGRRHLLAPGNLAYLCAPSPLTYP